MKHRNNWISWSSRRDGTTTNKGARIGQPQSKLEYKTSKINIIWDIDIYCSYCGCMLLCSYKFCSMEILERMSSLWYWSHSVMEGVGLASCLSSAVDCIGCSGTAADSSIKSRRWHLYQTIRSTQQASIMTSPVKPKKCCRNRLLS